MLYKVSTFAKTLTKSWPAHSNKMGNEHIEAIKQREKAYHESFREGGPLPDFSVEEFRSMHLEASYETGHYRSDNKRFFLSLIIRDGGWEGKTVLDYACGTGSWATYFALTGAKEVIGFDIGESGIRRARERTDRMGLSDKLKFEVMDATRLTFPDDYFDLVVGPGVLHHVIKYPGVFENLHRVMKPATKGYFLENLADFPLWWLWWKIKGEVEEGDVPIFAKEIHKMTQMFSKSEIIGDTFFASINHFVWKWERKFLWKALLKASIKADEALFKIFPRMRSWGCFSYIILTK